MAGVNHDPVVPDDQRDDILINQAMDQNAGLVQSSNPSKVLLGGSGNSLKDALA
jgi:hypothetical protein